MMLKAGHQHVKWKLQMTLMTKKTRQEQAEKVSARERIFGIRKHNDTKFKFVSKQKSIFSQQ